MAVMTQSRQIYLFSQWFLKYYATSTLGLVHFLIYQIIKRKKENSKEIKFKNYFR